jgi:hypothetical protein
LPARLLAELKVRAAGKLPDRQNIAAAKSLQAKPLEKPLKNLGISL